MPDETTPKRPQGATLPPWACRADYANSVVRVGKAREDVAVTRTAYYHAKEQLAKLEAFEADDLNKLVGAALDMAHELAKRDPEASS